MNKIYRLARISLPFNTNFWLVGLRLLGYSLLTHGLLAGYWQVTRALLVAYSRLHLAPKLLLAYHHLFIYYTSKLQITDKLLKRVILGSAVRV